ncbi:hypothetical protein FOZ76_14580 [Verticiella sediminum]|uniref:Uncharacterized protein n=1 Tax=Verticiella sediminum TaxID=1247510 RepID=A0A556AID1_9BURK|nr:hypothetical protein [Verticiella sediminum]TSH92643.1 hypothetical protein FOZ76_14580 [Verticiella sediminum]
MREPEIAAARADVELLLDHALEIARARVAEPAQTLVAAIFERLCVEYDLAEPGAGDTMRERAPDIRMVRPCA